MGTFHPLSIHWGRKTGSKPNKIDLEVAEMLIKSRVCWDERRMSLDSLVELYMKGLPDFHFFKLY